MYVETNQTAVLRGLSLNTVTTQITLSNQTPVECYILCPYLEHADWTFLFLTNLVLKLFSVQIIIPFPIDTIFNVPTGR